MYHAPSKRKQLAQRILIYSLMTLTVICLVFVLMFFMQGYRFNQAEGRIEQGGLVQFGSRPSGASVTIDGAALGTRTTAKTTMTPGPHAITMQRTGYQRWQKSIDVKPGDVLWLDYARLVPVALEPQNVLSFDTVTGTTVSPDKRWMAVKQTAADAVITLVDLSKEPIETESLELPETAVSVPAEGKAEQFTLQEFDSSSRYIIVKHAFDDDKVEWLVVDIRNVAATKNITKLVGIDASKVAFTNADSKKLYIQTAHEIRHVDIDASTLSGPLVSNVADFSLYKNTILYTTRFDEKTKQRTIGYFDSGADKPRVLRSYGGDDDATLRVAAGKYFENTYITLAHGESVEIMRGDLPRSDSADIATSTTVAAMNVPGGVTHVSNINNGRFVVAQADQTYVVYDLSLKKTTTTQLPAGPSIKRKLGWIDSYHVWSDIGGMARLLEFDGANQHDIMPVAEGFDVTLSTRGTYLYGISSSTQDQKMHLTRVRMILP